MYSSNATRFGKKGRASAPFAPPPPPLATPLACMYVFEIPCAQYIASLYHFTYCICC